MAEVAVAAVSYITGLTGTAAAVATTAAVAVAATSAVAILSQQPEAPNAQGQLTSLNLASNAARRLQIGTRGNGGSLVDWYTYGDKNQFAELVVYLGEGPMGDLTGIWSSGRKVYSGTLTHGNRVQLTEFDSPDGRAWIEYYDGRPGQTASARLVSATSGAWASSNVGEGCAYVIISLRWDPDTMPAIASFFVETEGAKLYDRRLDSTAGGSGSHRLKDPSTWEVSSNPAVALDHYLLGRYRDASSEPTFGVGLDPSLVNYSRFAAMANLSDEAVTVTQTQWYSTTQPRYEANGIILSTDSYKDTILNLCRSMNARASDLGGELGVIDNEAKAAVIDLEDKDVAPEATEIYIEKKSRDDLIGGVRGNYQDPDNNYNPTDYPSYTDSAWETEDGSVLEYDTLDLDFETDPERAQRLAKMHALRARRQASLQGAYNMKALILEDGDWFTRTTEKFPSGKTFEVIGSPVLDTSTMTVKINAIEVDTSDTAWNAATDPRPVVAPVASSSGLPPQLGSANISIQPTTYVSPGGMELPAIEVRNLAYDDEIPEALEVEVALDAGDGSPLDDAQTVYMPAGREYGTLAPLLPDTDYLLRTRRVLNERTSGWTIWSAFTTTANYTVESIANQGWGATATEAQAANALAAGSENSPVPDHNYYDADFWNLPAGVGFDEQSGIWGTSAPRRSLVISPGTYDFYSEYFDIEPDSTYEVIVRYWNGFGTFSGYVSPQIHIPFVAFWGIVNGASANGSDERITAAGTAGTIKRTVTFSGGTSRVQFRTEANFTGPANFYIRYELRKVPKWSQVQDDGSRPEDNANVTGDHTALAVVGQGPLATSIYDEGDIFDAATTSTPLNSNPHFTDPRSPSTGVPQGWTDWVQGATISRSTPRYNSAALAAYLDANNHINGNYGLFQNNLPAQPNKKYKVRLTMRRTGGSYYGCGVYVNPRSSAGASLTSAYRLDCATVASTAGDVQAHHDGITTWEVIYTMPANTNYVIFYLMGRWTGFPSYNAGEAPFQGHVLECSLTEVTDAERRTETQEDGANVTGAHTALAFVGQGDLATANAASVRKVTTSISGNGDTFLVGSGSAVGNVWHQAASLTIDTDASGSVEVGFNCHFDGIAGAAQNMTNAPYATVVARVKRGSTVIASGIRIARVVCDSSGDVDPWSGSSFVVVDDSPTGSSTAYSVELMVEDADPKSPTATICELLTGRGEFMKVTSYPGDANDFS